MTAIIEKLKNFNLKKVFSNKDTRTVVINIGSAFLIKGLALVVSLLTVPAFISYFNDNTYLGVWYTVLSIVLWFLTFDLGIGNGIRNSLVGYFVKKDRLGARRIISSGLAASFIAAILIWTVGATIIHATDWDTIFNIGENIVPPGLLEEAMLLMFSAIALRLALVAIGSIFYALQMSSINNFLLLVSSASVYVYILLFRFSTPEEALINVAHAYIWLYNLPVIIAGIILFGTKLRDLVPSPKFITLKALRQLTSVGGVFFYCQILFTLLTNSDQFIITRWWGAVYTVDYTFYFRLTSIIGMVVALCMTPLWSMITKAREEQNHTWLFKLYRLLSKLSLGVIALEFLFIPFLQPIMNVWLKADTIRVDYVIASAFAAYGALFVLTNIQSTFVCGLGRMKTQYIWYTIGVFIKAGVIWLGYRAGWNWAVVIWSDVAALLPYVVIQTGVLNRFFQRIEEKNSLKL